MICPTNEERASDLSANDSFYKLVDDAVARFSRAAFIGGIGLLVALYAGSLGQRVLQAATRERSLGSFFDFVMEATRLATAVAASLGCFAFAWVIVLGVANSIQLAKLKNCPSGVGRFSSLVCSIFSREKSIYWSMFPVCAIALASLVLIVSGAKGAKEFIDIIWQSP